MDSEFFKLGKWRGNARLAPSERKMAVGNCIDASYLPFSHGSPGPWPFFNMRIGLAITYFSQLNGSNNYSAAYGYTKARDSNSLVAYSYIVF